MFYLCYYIKAPDWKFIYYLKRFLVSTKLFVGSLPVSFDNEKLKQTFEKHGAVLSAKVITDRTSHKSKGFGFVEMKSSSDAYEAVKALHESKIEGKSIIVNETN